MLVVLGCMALDELIFASLRLSSESEYYRASYINSVVTSFLFSSVSWLLLLQWYQAY